MNRNYNKESITYELGVKVSNKREVKTIDEILDEYNDYMELYRNFGDKEYKDKADLIMQGLNDNKVFYK